MHTIMMPTYVHLIDLKRWFIECHIFMPKKAFDYGKTEIYKISKLYGYVFTRHYFSYFLKQSHLRFTRAPARVPRDLRARR